MNTENMYENFNSMNELHTIATVQLVLKVDTIFIICVPNHCLSKSNQKWIDTRISKEKR